MFSEFLHPVQTRDDQLHMVVCRQAQWQAVCAWQCSVCAVVAVWCRCVGSAVCGRWCRCGGVAWQWGGAGSAFAMAWASPNRRICSSSSRRPFLQ